MCQGCVASSASSWQTSGLGPSSAAPTHDTITTHSQTPFNPINIRCSTAGRTSRLLNLKVTRIRLYQLHATEAAYSQRTDDTEITERQDGEECSLCLQPAEREMEIFRLQIDILIDQQCPQHQRQADHTLPDGLYLYWRARFTD